MRGKRGKGWHGQARTGAGVNGSKSSPGVMLGKKLRCARLGDLCKLGLCSQSICSCARVRVQSRLEPTHHTVWNARP